ncbi:MAG: hypothetical protein KBF89_01495 [Acidimicrobiia bacterium]|nr:hypothetical protein [Acidimicrobiia bacterium]
MAFANGDLTIVEASELRAMSTDEHGRLLEDCLEKISIATSKVEKLGLVYMACPHAKKKNMILDIHQDIDQLGMYICTLQ